MVPLRPIDRVLVERRFEWMEKHFRLEDLATASLEPEIEQIAWHRGAALPQPGA
jgi:hypothetical protein